MTDTPAKPFPVISEGTTVKIKLGALIGCVVALIGFTGWLTTIYNIQNQQGQDIQDIKADLRAVKERLGVVSSK